MAGAAASIRPRRRAAATASEAAAEFLSFVGQTGSPAHTVQQAKQRLEAAGFVQLEDSPPWSLTPGGKYFITKEGTSICAFAVGKAFDQNQGGAVIAAAHTDSPCLKLRPCSKMPKSAGMLQVGVDTYGGGLWHTWFDRPLGVAGKVVVQTAEGMEERLVRVEKPLCLIPNLAIHLLTQKEREGFAPNKEVELQPVLCPPCGLELGGLQKGEKEEKEDKEEKEEGRHHAELLAVVAESVGVKAEEILDVDLCLMDSTPPCRIGAMVSTPRIDNVLSTWAAVDGLIAFTEQKEAFDASTDLLIAASFDHEEVGSRSAAGADSAVLERWLDQSLEALGSSWAQAVSRSFLLSCDCAHGLHPNYVGKHQAQHQPILGKGIVIKTNSNQRYATTPLLAQMVRRLGQLSEVPMQEFSVRNDCPCGSTIGPLLSSQLGIRTVDIGAPQWAMHSCRESAHQDDVQALRDLCKGFFQHFRGVDSSTTAL
ncbi:unnamed protein product [Effrenium voratum]|uniref:aspartyl aminopeptidase n=1 Tax=Effrenium voratum TaxID=2562239 RepID=A0AA36IVV6_9DINO|nr:unnamed protein product [Effrenium voratum]